MMRRMKTFGTIVCYYFLLGSETTNVSFGFSFTNRVASHPPCTARRVPHTIDVTTTVAADITSNTRRSIRTTTFLSSQSNNNVEEENDNNVTSSSSSSDDDDKSASSTEDPFGEFAAFLSETGNGDTSSQDDEATTDPTTAPTRSVVESIDTTMLWNPLLAVASRTGRGEFASQADTQEALSYIQLLELESPTPHPTTSCNSTSSAVMIGKWQLVFTDTQLFRSSPFFMAGRAVCTDGDQADQYNWFCDMHRKALAISTIGAVRQIISNTTLTSEFEVTVGAVPFLGATKPPFLYSGGLPLTIDGSIVSSADITPVENGTAWEIYMDTVRIKGSNIPGLRKLLDDGGLQLSSRKLANILESTIASYSTPKPVFRTTYLDGNFRISRDQDDHVFVYSKVSNDTMPTNYDKVIPDFGVSKLLEGFNDAITKIYL